MSRNSIHNKLSTIGSLKDLSDHELFGEGYWAKFFKESPRTWQNRRCRGEGPIFVKIGTHVRYRVRDVLQWCDSNTKQSTKRQIKTL